MPTRPPARSPAPQRKASESGKSSSAITSERINNDLETFRKSGGRIEVLGNTRVLTRVDEVVKKGAKGEAAT
jgi:hypothetical protein